jgi:ABC-2 type transport system permease protein
MTLRRLMAVARKETIQLRRDPRSLLMAFFLPALLLVLFGYAITWDVDDIRTAMLDQDGSARSRELLDSFWSSGYFTPVAQMQRPADVDRLIDHGHVLIAVVIPPDFGRDLDAGRPARLQVVVDGSDANTATIALGYARALVASYSSRILFRGRRFRAPLESRTRIWYNEELGGTGERWSSWPPRRCAARRWCWGNCCPTWRSASWTSFW